MRNRTEASWLGRACLCLALIGCSVGFASENARYEWTPDHLQVGVRWQPFDGRPDNNAADAARPVIAEDSSYAQFWLNWSVIEPLEINTDYKQHPSVSLQTIETAVDVCVAEGLQVEFVFWHCPAWASESGQAGGWRPKKDQFSAFTARIAHHFKGRVGAYQLGHEMNLAAMMQDANPAFIMDEIFTKGAQAIHAVYDADPALPVLISTSGMSPCEACPAMDGLKSAGAVGVDDFYNRMIANPELMESIDALNLNVSDHFDGYGCMDGDLIATAWGNYDLVRGKLDAAGYFDKTIHASESWIVWDDAYNAVDVTGDGLANEQDAYSKTVTIMGQCLERGLNTFNLPWSDNSNGWAMGLTKRCDYNGRYKTLDPTLVTPGRDGCVDVVTRKVILSGNDQDFTVKDGEGDIFTIEDYINPSDPNHLHYYIWKWYAQLAGGSDEVIRHAMAGEHGNNIAVWGIGYTGLERYKMSSYNRTKNKFKVLLYAGNANGRQWAKVSIPATIQNGQRYNNEFSKKDYRGEGFLDGETYYARIVTKDISKDDGSDVGVFITNSAAQTVTNGVLTATLGSMKPFTTIEFIKGTLSAGTCSDLLLTTEHTEYTNGVESAHHMRPAVAL